MTPSVYGVMVSAVTFTILVVGPFYPTGQKLVRSTNNSYESGRAFWPRFHICKNPCTTAIYLQSIFAVYFPSAGGCFITQQKPVSIHTALTY